MSPIKSSKFKTQKTAFYVLLTYIFVFQLSGAIFWIETIASFTLGLIDAPQNQKGAILTSWWTFVMGVLSLLIIFMLVRRNKDFFNIFKGEKATTIQAVGWGIIGFFLVFFGQTIGVYIETEIFGIQSGSDNTKTFIEIAKAAPIMILSIVLIGPILEEFVFRRVIFGSLIQAQGYWLSAIISGVIFALIHFDFTHILLYTICGLVFAYLYHKTKRLLTSIVAHILLNSFVVFTQLNAERIQQFLDSLPK